MNEEVTALREKVLYLEETVRQLTEADGIEPETEWGLIPIEKRLFRLLRLDKLVTRAWLYDALYWDRGENSIPEPHVITVYVCRLRDQLRAHSAPYHIETAWGEGYILRTGCEPNGFDRHTGVSRPKNSYSRRHNGGASDT